LLLLMAALLKPVHACPHRAGFFLPLFGVRMRCRNGRGCGCLIPSSPCLPFRMIGLRPSFPGLSFAPLFGVHHVLYDFRGISGKKLVNFYRSFRNLGPLIIL
jgi:hypothetical protein